MSATSSRGLRAQLSILFLALSLFAAHAADAPTPYLDAGKPVDWWFVFKFNTKSFPHCRADAKQACIFGGTVQNYKQWGPAIRVREQREQDAAGRHRMCRRYRRRSGRRDVQRGLQRHAVLRDLERSVLRRSRDLRLHQGMQLALGPRQGHAGLERGGRGRGDAGLDAVLAGRGQQEISAQVRRQHARLRQGRRRRGEPALLLAQAHQG